jgi:DDB1- and CUL4-associated factor 13
MPPNGLPTHSAIQEKIHRTQGSWGNIPGVAKNRRLRILAPVSRQLQGFNVSRLQRKRGPLLLCVACVALLMTVLLVHRSAGESEAPWTPQVGDPPTLVFKREDLQRIWNWEIESGHYPSRRSSEFLFFTYFRASLV